MFPCGTYANSVLVLPETGIFSVSVNISAVPEEIG